MQLERLRPDAYGRCAACTSPADGRRPPTYDPTKRVWRDAAEADTRTNHGIPIGSLWVITGADTGRLGQTAERSSCGLGAGRERPQAAT
jgi:hypothetical protein